jgi:hypothetical protein
MENLFIFVPLFGLGILPWLICMIIEERKNNSNPFFQEEKEEKSFCRCEKLDK